MNLFLDLIIIAFIAVMVYMIVVMVAHLIFSNNNSTKGIKDEQVLFTRAERRKLQRQHQKNKTKRQY